MQSMSLHPDFSQAGSGSTGTSPINTDPTERELKRLTLDGQPETMYVVLNRFYANKMVNTHSGETQLLTSQRDTRDRVLLQMGGSLRTRASIVWTPQPTIKKADVCIKVRRPTDAAGSMMRSEFERRTDDFFGNDLRVLTEKYNPGDAANSDLYRTLSAIGDQPLFEHFRVDTLRNRYVIHIPNEDIGLSADQNFYGELLLDRVRYVMDLPQVNATIVFNPHCELEFEALMKPCDYNPTKESHRMYCQNLSEADVISGMSYAASIIDAVGGRRLITTDLGKAERGVQALDQVKAALSMHPSVEINDPSNILLNGIHDWTQPIIIRASDTGYLGWDTPVITLEMLKRSKPAANSNSHFTL